jgi:hypothetical protein
MDTSIISMGRSGLGSELTRQIIGTRTIDLYQTYRENSRGKSRRQRLGGFLNMFGQGALDYLMSNLTQIVMGSLLTAYLFDWNQTDAEIQAQMKANELAMITSAGRLAADGLIRFTAMGATKLAKHRYPRIDPTALAMMEEENQEELVNGIRSFLIASRSNIMSNVALATFMSGRSMMFGSQTKKTESFIISDRIEKIAESQKNPQVKAFLTGFIDQAEDAIFDLAFLVCNTVTATYEMNKLAAKQGNGPARLVQLTPDKDDPSTKVMIYGPQDQVMTAITEVVTQQAVLENKDMGQIVQVGIDTALKAARNERQITVYFYNGLNGATRLADGKRAVRRTMKISNLKISTDWDKLKAALTPFDGGNFKVIAHLDDGHQLHGFFATEAEGKSYFTAISALCNGDIKKWTVIEPNSEAKFRITAGRFTVSTATIRIAKQTSDETKKAFIDSTGQMWKVKALKLPLRKADKPDGIDAAILNPWAADPL